jgi:hypothetical protein
MAHGLAALSGGPRVGNSCGTWGPSEYCSLAVIRGSRRSGVTIASVGVWEGSCYFMVRMDAHFLKLLTRATWFLQNLTM